MSSEAADIQSVVRSPITVYVLQRMVEVGDPVVPVEIALDAAERVRLHAGSSANADIFLEERRDMLVIPERVVTDEGDSASVEIPGPAGSGMSATSDSASSGDG